MGTGLGLPYCRSLLAKLDSELTLESPAEGGSVFSFELAVSVAPAVSSPESSSDDEAPAGLRVLVADDMRINRRVLSMQITQTFPGVEIAEAVSGEEALLMLTEGDFHIAFLDEYMGFDDGSLRGSEVSRRFRKAEAQREAQRKAQHEGGDGGGGTAKAPVLLIAVTGNAGIGDWDDEARSAGLDGSFGKPVPSDFGQAVTRMLRKRK